MTLDGQRQAAVVGALEPSANSLCAMRGQSKALYECAIDKAKLGPGVHQNCGCGPADLTSESHEKAEAADPAEMGAESKSVRSRTRTNPVFPRCPNRVPSINLA